MHARACKCCVCSPHLAVEGVGRRGQQQRVQTQQRGALGVARGEREGVHVSESVHVHCVDDRAGSSWGQIYLGAE